MREFFADSGRGAEPAVEPPRRNESETRSVQILLTTFGSSGDVDPMLGIGVALAQRGHRVTLLTNEHFEPAARRAGFDFAAVGTAAEYDDITSLPDLWDPRRGFDLVTAAWTRLLPETYEAVRARHVPGDTVVVASAPSLGARVARERLGVPLATVHLQPSGLRSLEESPVFPGLPLPQRLPRIARALVYRLVDAVADRRLAAPVNAFRAELGLPPVRRLLNDWWNSPDCVLGLFPDWFATPRPDWPRRTMLTGFPLHDGGADGELPAAARAFLDAGDAPIVFTPGSAMRHGRRFFETALAACGRLGRRAVFLSPFEDQIPNGLPPAVLHLPFAPFSRILPRCAAIVHHGGIGTVAQGLAAGIPQVIMPMGFDQPDNAARLRRLGVGASLPPRAFRPQRLARVLAGLTGSEEVLRRCRDLAARLDGARALERIADAVERLGAP